ncbi:hypothetical protein V1477_006164 [Vespula maculifrons]|uniref:Uncharacterized protein n=1 Tax=Vespula maculifrons TaxID=7453 RepID=A0ABD2CLI1_VESMC
MSVKKLIEKDYEINFNKEWCTIKNKDNALAKADKLKKFSKILIVKNWDMPNCQLNCKIGNYDVGFLLPKDFLLNNSLKIEFTNKASVNTKINGDDIKENEENRKISLNTSLKAKLKKVEKTMKMESLYFAISKKNTDEWLLAMAIVKSYPCWVRIFKTWLNNLKEKIIDCRIILINKYRLDGKKAKLVTREALLWMSKSKKILVGASISSRSQHYYTVAKALHTMPIWI